MTHYQALCSQCGSELTGATERIVPVPGQESVRVCDQCEPAVKEKAIKMQAALDARPREIHIARCDTLYSAVMQTCMPIASRVYQSNLEREGRIATREGIANYMMGFVDAAFCLVSGELRLATMAKTAEKQLTEG